MPGQPGLRTEFENSQSHGVKFCLKAPTATNIYTKNKICNFFAIIMPFLDS